MDEGLIQKAAQALEWPRLREVLAQHAQSTMGAARCRSLPLSDDLADASMRQQETTEMVAMLAGMEPVPTLTFPDIRDLLTRASKRGVLEAPELRDCAIVAVLMEEMDRWLTCHRNEVPALSHFIASLRPTRHLWSIKLAIEAAIQPDGSIKESATPELRRLTYEAHELKQEIRLRL
ncbi:MAG TPA: hypothetical protein VLA47_00055, partial [Nitrospira sp.]|nr:hypothetical protein [Nitrospira sp.]